MAESLSLRSATLQALLRGAVEDETAEPTLEDEDGELPLQLRTPPPLPEGGLSLQVGEAYNYIVLLFDQHIDFMAAQDLFGIKPVQDSFHQSRSIGVGRVVRGGAFVRAYSKLMRQVIDQKDLLHKNGLFDPNYEEGIE